MHIKDLSIDIELDRTALAAVRGGSCSGVPNCQDGPLQQPTFPTFSGDLTQLNAEIKSYFGDVKAAAGFPSADIGIPDIAAPATPVAVF